MMPPTVKAKNIEDLLTSIAGISRREAFDKNICAWCKKTLNTKWRTPLCKREHSISGMCQTCQNATFGTK
jgi:hypothetical protein